MSKIKTTVNPASSDAVLTRLNKLHPKLIDLSLERVQRLLSRLGNPEQNLPPVVHVAGTNGKGSVIAMIRAALEASGLRGHVYTSPHLVQFHERIRVASKLIDEVDLTALLQECETVNAGGPITVFEITTVAAFLIFSRTPADFVLLETGLGGRLDATNLVSLPRITVITPISHDHQKFLGEGIANIALEKAGILKPGVPCILARQEAVARNVIIEQAAALGVALVEQGIDWDICSENNYLVFKESTGTSRFPRPALEGEHQVENAGVALAALSSLGDLRPSSAEIAKGLEGVDWPARLQKIEVGPLVNCLEDGWELWVDGGHNYAASESIARYIDASWTDRPSHLICGMMKSKQAADFLSPLIIRAHSLWTVAIPGEINSFSAEDLAQLANADAKPATSISTAVLEICEKNSVPSRILICGSLYLVGAVLAENS